MSTGTKIVQGALGMIGAHSPIKPAGPESMETGRTMTNSMIARWQDNNIEFGAVPLQAIGGELSEPLGLTSTIMFNLALELHPLFPGSQISSELRRNANRTYQDLLKKCQGITIPKPVARATLPKGQGNNQNRFQSDTFFDSGEEIG